MNPKRRRQILLTIWLALPILMIAGLMYAVSYWIQRGPVGGQKQPPVGAGAGDTGGANAIGEARKRAQDREIPRPPPSDEPYAESPTDSPIDSPNGPGASGG